MWSAILAALGAIFKWVLGRIAGPSTSPPPITPAQQELNDVEIAKNAENAFDQRMRDDPAVVRERDPFERD